MAIRAMNAEKASSFDRLMLELVGKEKSGKSRVAATARKPILFNDFDRRWQSIAGIPGVFVLSYEDEVKPNMQPTAFNDFLTSLYVLETKGTLRALGEYYKVEGWQTWPDVPPKTCVADSMASLAKICNSYALYTNKDLRRSIKVGGQEMYFNNGWDAVNAEMESVYKSIMRMIALPFSPDIIIIFHEDAEEAADSSPEKRRFTGKFEAFPKRYNGMFNKHMSEVWRVTRDGNTVWPLIQVAPTYQFTASSNLDFSKLKADQINPTAGGPNISKMIELVTK